MRKALCIILLAVFAAACSTDVMEPVEMGSISLSLSSDVEVDAATRADAQDYDCSNFIVDIAGTALYDGRTVEQHFDAYGQMPASVELPYGRYVVAAQSCTEAAAEVGYGSARYCGESKSVELRSKEPMPVSVTCKMVNGKATVTFDDGFMQDFTDITVALTIGERTVPLTAEQANALTGVYFNVVEEGSELRYNITATVAKGTEEERTVSYNNNASPILLSPGKWAKMTIKSNHNGVIGPSIDVNDDMEIDDSLTESIDPDGGEDVTDFPTVSIQVDTQIEDATVIDCIMDVL